MSEWTFFLCFLSLNRNKNDCVKHLYEIDWLFFLFYIFSWNRKTSIEGQYRSLLRIIKSTMIILLPFQKFWLTEFESTYNTVFVTTNSPFRWTLNKYINTPGNNNRILNFFIYLENVTFENVLKWCYCNTDPRIRS